MDVDVLILVAPTLADLADAMCPDEREALGQHSGRSEKFPEPLNAIRGEARFLLQLLDRGAFRRRVRVGVPDEARRKFDAAAVWRNTRLVDQYDLALIFREDDDRADVVRPARIFPVAALEHTHIFAGPHHLRRRKIVEFHSSMSLSGISLVSVAERGKCSARTAPTRSIAATMPSAIRPCFTSTSSATMASPQVSGVVTDVIASSATISARCSAIER